MRTCPHCNGELPGLVDIRLRGLPPEVADLVDQINYHLTVLVETALEEAVGADSAIKAAKRKRERAMAEKRVQDAQQRWARVASLLRRSRNELATYGPNDYRNVIAAIVGYVLDSSDNPPVSAAVEAVAGDALVRVPKGKHKDRLLSEALLSSDAALKHLKAAVDFARKGQRGEYLAACDAAVVAVDLAKESRAKPHDANSRSGDEPGGADRQRKALTSAAKRRVDGEAVPPRRLRKRG